MFRTRYTTKIPSEDLFPPEDYPLPIVLDPKVMKQALRIPKWILDLPRDTKCLTEDTEDEPAIIDYEYNLGTCVGPSGLMAITFGEIMLHDPTVELDVHGKNYGLYPIRYWKEANKTLHHIPDAKKVVFQGKGFKKTNLYKDVELILVNPIRVVTKPPKVVVCYDLNRAHLLLAYLNRNLADAVIEQKIVHGPTEHVRQEMRTGQLGCIKNDSKIISRQHHPRPELVIPIPDIDEDLLAEPEPAEENIVFKTMKTGKFNLVQYRNLLNFGETSYQNDKLLFEHYDIFKNLDKWSCVVDSKQEGVNTLRNIAYAKPFNREMFKELESNTFALYEYEPEYERIRDSKELKAKAYNLGKLGMIDGSCAEYCCEDPDCYEVICSKGCCRGTTIGNTTVFVRFKMSREDIDYIMKNRGTLGITTNLSLRQLSSLWTKAQDVNPGDLVLALTKVERPIYKYERPIEVVESGYRLKPFKIKFDGKSLLDNWHVLVMSDSQVDALFFTGRRHINRELNFIHIQINGVWITHQISDNQNTYSGGRIQPGKGAGALSRFVTPGKGKRIDELSPEEYKDLFALEFEIEPTESVTFLKFSMSDTANRYTDGLYDFLMTDYPIEGKFNRIEAEIESFSYKRNTNLVESYSGLTMITDEPDKAVDLTDAYGPLLPSGFSISVNDNIEPITQDNGTIELRSTFRNYLGLVLKTLANDQFVQAYHLNAQINAPPYNCHHKATISICQNCAISLFNDSEYHNVHTKVLSLAIKKTVDAAGLCVFYHEWPEYVKLYGSGRSILLEELFDYLFGSTAYDLNVGHVIQDLPDRYVFGADYVADRYRITAYKKHLNPLPIARLNERVKTMGVYTVGTVDSLDPNFMVNSWVLQNSNTLGVYQFKTLVKLTDSGVVEVSSNCKLKSNDQCLSCCLHERNLCRVERIGNIIKHPQHKCCQFVWLYSTAHSDVSRVVQLFTFYSLTPLVKPINVEAIIGGPGTGKSFSTRNRIPNSRPTDTIAIGKSRAVVNKLGTELEDLATVMTAESFFKKYYKLKQREFKTLVLEEATLFSQFDLHKLCGIIEPSRVIMVGDPTQGSWKPDIGAAVFGDFPNALTGVNAHYLTKVYRYGKSITDALKHFGLTLEPADHQTSLTIVNGLDGRDELLDAMFLTWTINDYNELSAKNLKVMMVESAQGYDWDNVVIYLNAAHSVQSVYNKMNWIIALSRAKKNMTICSVGEPITNGPATASIKLIALMCDIMESTPCYVARDHIDLLPTHTTTIFGNYANLMARIARTTQRIVSLTAKYGKTAALLATNPVTAAFSVLMAGWQLYFGFFMSLVTAFNGMKPQIQLIQSLQHDRPPTALGDEYTTSPPLSWFLDFETKLAEEIRQAFAGKMDTLEEFMNNIQAAKEEGIQSTEYYDNWNDYANRTKVDIPPTELLRDLQTVFNVKFSELSGKIQQPIEEKELEYYDQSAITAASVAGYLVGTRFDHSVQGVFESALKRKIPFIPGKSAGILTKTAPIGQNIVSTPAGWVKRNLMIYYAIDQLTDLSSLNLKTIYNNIMGIQQMKQLRRFEQQEWPMGVSRAHTNRPVGAMLSTNSTGRLRLQFGEHDSDQLIRYSAVPVNPMKVPKTITYVGADTGDKLEPALFETPTFYKAPSLDIYRMITIEMITSRYIGEKYNHMYWAGVLWDFEGLDVRGLKRENGQLPGLDAFAMQTMYIELVTVKTTVQEVRDWIFARSRPTNLRHARSHVIAGKDDHNPNQTPIIIKHISSRKIASGLPEIDASIAEQVAYAETLISRRELLRQAEMRNIAEKPVELNMEDFNQVLTRPTGLQLVSAPKREALPKPEPPPMWVKCQIIGMWEPPFVSVPDITCGDTIKGWLEVEKKTTPERRVWKLGGKRLVGFRWRLIKTIEVKNRAAGERILIPEANKIIEYNNFTVMSSMIANAPDEPSDGKPTIHTKVDEEKMAEYNKKLAIWNVLN
uniref:(+)RNA virus helicase C-terminal domain-containing protein n=1 Tax=Rhizoctonia solani putative virus 1 TaxID=2600107 RepID=A0A5B8GQ52_9VIRU|nr:hypothetical protein [Rhizoctonia solani putative virus 1]